MLKFSEIFEFSKENFRKIPVLKEFECYEWFEWFGPSPIEPFNSVLHAHHLDAVLRLRGVLHLQQALHEVVDADEA